MQLLSAVCIYTNVQSRVVKTDPARIHGNPKSLISENISEIISEGLGVSEIISEIISEGLGVSEIISEIISEGLGVSEIIPEIISECLRVSQTTSGPI